MAKTDKNSEIPKFLLDKRYLMGSVIFILTFSFLFMTLYTPFSITAWFSITNLTHLGMTAAFYFVALAIMLISKQIMYSVQNRVTFTFAKYILWLFGEMIVISLFYTFFTSVFISPSVQPAWIILLKAIGCVLLIMAIPYTILTLYAAYKAKTEELQMLQYEMSLSNEPTVVYPSLINLYDYNGTLKLTINSDTLYYMESQDNYVKTAILHAALPHEDHRGESGRHEHGALSPFVYGERNENQPDQETQQDPLHNFVEQGHQAYPRVEKLFQEPYREDRQIQFGSLGQRQRGRGRRGGTTHSQSRAGVIMLRIRNRAAACEVRMRANASVAGLRGARLRPARL